MATVADIQSQIAAAKEKIAKLEGKAVEAAAEEAMQGKQVAFSLRVQDGVPPVVEAIVKEFELPVVYDRGLSIYLHKEEGSDKIACDILYGKPRVGATGPRKPRGEGKATNGNRRSVGSLGIKSFTLSDGTEVKSAAQVLDKLGIGYTGHGEGGDAPARQIVKWADENADEADKIVLTLNDGSALTLKEAVGGLS